LSRSSRVHAKALITSTNRATTDHITPGGTGFRGPHLGVAACTVLSEARRECAGEGAVEVGLPMAESFTDDVKLLWEWPLTSDRVPAPPGDSTPAPPPLAAFKSSLIRRKFPVRHILSVTGFSKRRLCARRTSYTDCRPGLSFRGSYLGLSLQSPSFLLSSRGFPFSFFIIHESQGPWTDSAQSKLTSPPQPSIDGTPPSRGSTEPRCFA
jgi:hypothetical protein